MIGQLLTTNLTAASSKAQLALLMGEAGSAIEKGTWWMPQAASTNAGDIDWLFYWIYWMCVFFFIVIVGFAALFAWKYRRKHPDQPARSQFSHSTAIEIAWTIPPIIITVFLFVWGWQGYVDFRTPPKQAYEIQVEGQKWKWLFTYPNGWVDDVLHVPVNEPIQLTISSQDVLHSVYIPAFRVKMDAVPGRFTKLWFEANKPGEYHLFCTEFCGTDHSMMRTSVVVHPEGTFEQYLEEAEEKLLNMPPVELGEKLYKGKGGCIQCHSIDGSPNKGPSFKGLFGKTETFTDGTTGVADENYLKESIIDPQKKIVAGYNPVMPTYAGKLRDKEIAGIIAYIKSLK